MTTGAGHRCPRGTLATNSRDLDDLAAPLPQRLAPRRRRHDALFTDLRAAPALVLAVSGGPDSMALLHMVSRWRAGLDDPAPAIHVATVDHGLRPESRAEALLVASVAAELGFPHAILSWRGQKPSTRLQERARAARYRLLGDHARTVGATAILTAHHADDQAETVLLRLTRGSGICGLGGMARETRFAPDVMLVRPLLHLPKVELVALCHEVGQAFVEDSSNADPAFARVRFRAEAASLVALGLDAPGLARFARRMARANAALEAEAARLQAIVEPELDGGRFRAPLEGAREAEAEIVLRLLRGAIEHVVPERRFIRLERLETLTEAMRDALRAGRPYRATLGGARVVLSRDGVLEVTRETVRQRGRARAERVGPAEVDGELQCCRH